jgi:hypothetical protein
VPHLWLLCLCLSLPTRADSPPQLKTPEGAFDVYDWVIFICDPNQPQANASAIYQSTLPNFADSRRAPAPVEKAADPQPVGVIRFTGSSGSDKVDVQITNKGGKFLALWPKAQSRTNAALWQNLTITDAAPTSQEQLGGNSWLNTLRAPANVASLLKDGRGERFLLYDAEPTYRFPLKVATSGSGGATAYTVTNADKLTLHDVTFYKQEPDGWHTATIASLAPTPQPSSTKPTTKPATRQAAAATHPATTSVAATKPTGTPISLTTTNLTDTTQLLAPWKEKLSAAGLPTTDQDLIVSILRRHALDGKRLTAVYRLDADEMEQLMPLEVTPQPRKTVRIGLMIAKNIDPAIIHEVEDLVAQLGDNSWEKREAAQESLAKLGPAAKPRLDASLKTAKDPEVIYRIEQLLAALATPPAPNPNGG